MNFDLHASDVARRVLRGAGRPRGLRGHALWLLVVAAACSSSARSEPQIRLVTPPGGLSPYVVVSGITRSEAAALRAADWDRARWTQLLRVSVKGSAASAADSLPMIGRYSVEHDGIRFTPLFPFDPGREYDVRFEAGRLPGAEPGARTVRTTVSTPKPPAMPSTAVARVYPSGGIVPENQLRLYVQFSAPMGRHGGLDYISLVDEDGRTVEDPFLPLDADLWNADRTRYTVFFDPGRQKRGILPNRAMGPSLQAGRTYTLVVKREWPDTNGQPLTETFSRRFRVGPPDLSPLDHRSWTLDFPLAGTRSPLVVRFPEPLDHGLLQRALGVRRGAAGIAGEPRVDADETRWSFTPQEPWQPGEYELVILSVLEDLAGNRIGRAFEVRGFERTDPSPEPESLTIPFRVAGR